jgi:hypothetical protein
MTSTSPDLPRPNRRGLSCDSYDVAHNHRDVARTSSQRETGAWRSNSSLEFPMGKFPLKRRLSPEERRALELLASNPNGATEELLVHSFTRRMLTGLVDDRLATARRQSIRAPVPGCSRSFA